MPKNEGDNEEDDGEISEFDRYGEDQAVGDALWYPKNTPGFLRMCSFLTNRITTDAGLYRYLDDIKLLRRCHVIQEEQAGGISGALTIFRPTLCMWNTPSPPNTWGGGAYSCSIKVGTSVCHFQKIDIYKLCPPWHKQR